MIVPATIAPVSADDQSRQPPDPVRAAIPNALTVLRLLLIIAFVLILSGFRIDESSSRVLLVSAILFVIAATTDALDGALARRWNAISRFGRVMDPLADKLLILGAFILMAGPGFHSHGDGQVTGVAPWMVVLILAREMLATSIRAVVETGGEAMAAVWSGKAKMALQAICVPAVLTLIWLYGGEGGHWSRMAIRVLVWSTVAVTVVSGWRYFLTTLLFAIPQRAGVDSEGDS